jgi:hypothetical protein
MMPQGSFRKMRKLFGSGESMRSTKVMSFWPMASRLPQRASEATTSSPVTGLPSWNSRPSRSVKLHCFLSALTDHLSTICG